MKKDIKLYNALFPLWFFYLFPTSCILLVVPGNFIIDSIVLLLSVAALKIENKRSFYKKSIVKVFLCGLSADIIGAALAFAAIYFELGSFGDELYITIPAMIFASVLIFFFDYMVSFKNCEKRQRIILSLIFAVATAPYTFLVPTEWLYGY